MVEVTPLEAKIIKQVEYYFGDLNLSRDKFMKTTISENDGWVPMDTMLKFNRLKALSDDPDFIVKALSKSSSGLVEVGPAGIRRNPTNNLPESVEQAFSVCSDRSVYVKGFGNEATLDEIILWLEKYGGSTLNVHMRRFPKDKKFKGSIFAVFEKKEDAEKFIKCPEAEVYNKNTMIRKWQDDYWKEKKAERAASAKARAEKHAIAEAHRDAQLNSRMVVGALLELSGLPPVPKDHSTAERNTSDNADGTNPNHSTAERNTSDNADIANPNGQTEPTSEEKSDQPTDSKDDLPVERTVAGLKTWLIEKLGTNFPIAWVDVEPAEGKAVVRFKVANVASSAWAKLTEVFGDSPITYGGSTLSGRTLTGDDEKAHWRLVIANQQQKHHNRQRRGRPGSKGVPAKRRRTD